MSQSNPTIVIATDFSPGSTAALRAAETLWPKETRLRVHLAHVLEPMAFVAPPASYWGAFEQDRTKEARAALAQTAQRLRQRRGAQVKVEQHLLAGPVHAEVCRLAKRLKASLIVVGTHGRTGLGHVLIGSVAERVVRHAGRPVLTVPLPTRRRRPTRR
jgi:nucleotide-binding universal stress UspA family protein